MNFYLLYFFKPSSSEVCFLISSFTQWIKQNVDGTEDAMCHRFNSCICGKRIKLSDENRIVPPSNQARLGEYPWAVYIKITYPDSTWYSLHTSYCVGTLITSSHVLTAGHCLQAEPRKKNSKALKPEALKVKIGTIYFWLR